ncbi:MAG: DNA methyltransferase, partial [Caldisphaera sp.]
PETHTPMYLMHKYWARKPHNVVAEYIKHYSKEGDIVLDPFSGSGVTGIEAVRLNRKGINIDLNPIASFIARNTAVEINLNKYEETLDKIKDIKKEINKLYAVKCDACGGTHVLTHTIYETSNNIERPIKIQYFCPKTNKSYSREPNKEDLKLIANIEENFEDIVKKQKLWYPKIKFVYDNGKPFLQLRHGLISNPSIDMLFTKRNLLALAMIFKQINDLPENTKEEKIIKELYKFTFTSAVAQASKMVWVIDKRAGKKVNEEVGSWTHHFYWNPTKYYEVNAWNCFIERFDKIKRGKKESNNLHAKITDNFKDLIENDKNLMIKTASVLNLTDEYQINKSIIPPNSIDYVFTDPPYGNSIQYYELSYLWESWLGLKEDGGEEIIINKNQGKNLEVYQNLLLRAFKEVYKVLKPNRYLTVTFHNTKIEIRNALIRNVVLAGFKLDKILYQPPARPSAKALLHPYGSPIGDYYIRFLKPETEINFKEPDIDREVQERIIVDAVTAILAERGEPTSYAWILNMIDTKLVERGYNLISNPQEIEKVLDKHIGKEFLIKEIKEGNSTVKKWWFTDPNSIKQLTRIPLSQRVKETVLEVLRRNITVSYDDVLREIFLTFQNSLTPETKSVKYFLLEYADKLPNSRLWKIKDSVRGDVREHQLKINSLIFLGKKLGYEVYTPDRVDEIKNIVMYPLILPMDAENLERVKEIDVLWIKNNKIEYAFEVENSTTIDSAIIRGSYINYNSIRVIVLPDHRWNKLLSVLKTSFIRKEFEDENWNILLYSKLEEYLSKKNKSIDTFNAVLIKPKIDNLGQKKI